MTWGDIHMKVENHRDNYKPRDVNSCWSDTRSKVGCPCLLQSSAWNNSSGVLDFELSSWTVSQRCSPYSQLPRLCDVLWQPVVLKLQAGVKDKSCSKIPSTASKARWNQRSHTVPQLLFFSSPSPRRWKGKNSLKEPPKLKSSCSRGNFWAVVLRNNRTGEKACCDARP